MALANYRLVEVRSAKIWKTQHRECDNSIEIEIKQIVVVVSFFHMKRLHLKPAGKRRVPYGTSYKYWCLNILIIFVVVFSSTLWNVKDLRAYNVNNTFYNSSQPECSCFFFVPHKALAIELRFDSWQIGFCISTVASTNVDQIDFVIVEVQWNKKKDKKMFKFFAIAVVLLLPAHVSKLILDSIVGG